MKLILTSTRTFKARTEDNMRLLLELRKGPGEVGELAKRLGWERGRVEGACRDAVGEAERTDYGWALTKVGRVALELGS
jgi:hypothetical protein